MLAWARGNPALFTGRPGVKFEIVPEQDHKLGWWVRRYTAAGTDIFQSDLRL